jgi:hydroxyacylglutathione hydrolase
MKVTEHIHAIKIPFKLMVSEGKTLDRFVYAYLIYGESICLIDSGVSGSHSMIFDYVKRTGRDPKEISILVLTHAHPDHIGGAQAVKKECGCKVAAHRDDKPWIEDVERQFRERQISNFYSLVEESVEVDVPIKDGDQLNLGAGKTLEVIHTPGHSRGSISLLFHEDRALISGDAVPISGTVPIYEDFLHSIESIRKLREIKGLKVLLTSWDEPHYGDRAYALMDDGLHYLQHIHEVVLKEKVSSPTSDIMQLSAGILKSLGLPEIALIPILVRSIEAHLKVADHQNLLQGEIQ